MSKVKYIIGHWTAGNYNPCATDFESYQLLIDELGRIFEGKPQGTTASTGGMNSITYNIACCGGLDRTPIQKLQIETFCSAVAKKLKEYNLPLNAFYTHAEIGWKVNNGTIICLLPLNKWLSANKGKIDLTKLPFDLKKQSHGDFLRNKIAWYYNKL